MYQSKYRLVPTEIPVGLDRYFIPWLELVERDAQSPTFHIPKEGILVSYSNFNHYGIQYAASNAQINDMHS